MPRRFVNDVRCWSVHQVIQAAHIRRDGQNSEGLKLLKCEWWNEAVHTHGTPTGLSEHCIHRVDAWNAFHADPRGRKAFDVGTVRCRLEPGVKLQEHEAPHGLINLVVLAQILVDDVLP